MFGRILRPGNRNWDGINLFELHVGNSPSDIATRVRRLGQECFARALDQSSLDSILQGRLADEAGIEDTTDPASPPSTRSSRLAAAQTSVEGFQKKQPDYRQDFGWAD